MAISPSRFGGEDSEIKIDVKVRESVLKDELAKMEDDAGKPDPTPPPFGEPPPLPGQEQKPPADGAEDEPPADEDEDEEREE